MDLKSFGKLKIETPKEWAVYFERGYWNKNAKGRPGDEIIINKSFSWGDEIWHIPAIYSCGKGAVIDFCVEIRPEKVKSFIDKWYHTLERGERLSREIREQMETENPMESDFRFELQVNGKKLVSNYGSSISWIPESCLPDGVESERESKELILHYGLDETRAWVFHRYSCLWATKRKPKIKSLKLKTERTPTAIQGLRFKNPSVGDVIKFVHPVHKTEHKLTVTDYQKSEFPINGFQHKEYEFPTHHTAMTYTLEPDLCEECFRICDCLDNEPPKQKPLNRFEPQASYDACSVAIIGGADGPTAVFTSSKSERHIALSALKFEPTDDIEWKMVFREKLAEDIEVDLLNDLM